MFKYLKQLFDVVNQSRQFAAFAENPEHEIVRHEERQVHRDDDSGMQTNSVAIDDRLTESSLGVNHTNNNNSTDPREAQTQLRDEKLWLENSTSSDGQTRETRCGDSRRFGESNVGGEENVSAEESMTEIEERDVGGERGECEQVCACANCLAATEIGECGVCLEPLQTRGVRSCSICANVVCSECASRLRRCAFCRVPLSMQRNRAIERLLDCLALPCRNARNGCQKLLRAETRLRHETSCDYALISCPVVKGNCEWEGKPGEILGHLKQSHDITPVASREIFVEVSNAWPYECGKCMANVGERIVYVTCYNQLFAVKVTRHRKKWNLTFFQLAHVGPATSGVVATGKYEVRMKLKAAGRRRFREVLPFGSFGRETPTVEINPRVAGDVSIEISIREYATKK